MTDTIHAAFSGYAGADRADAERRGTEALGAAVDVSALPTGALAALLYCAANNIIGGGNGTRVVAAADDDGTETGWVAFLTNPYPKRMVTYEFGVRVNYFSGEWECSVTSEPGSVAYYRAGNVRTGAVEFEDASERAWRYRA